VEKVSGVNLLLISFRNQPPCNQVTEKKREKSRNKTKNNRYETNYGRIGIGQFAYSPAYSCNFLIGPRTIKFFHIILPLFIFLAAYIGIRKNKKSVALNPASYSITTFLKRFVSPRAFFVRMRSSRAVLVGLVETRFLRTFKADLKRAVNLPIAICLFFH
jgi:hypothetical protein